MKNFVLTSGLIITGFFAFAFSSEDLQHEAGKKPLPIEQDTLPHVTSTINATIEGRRYKVSTLNNTPTELYINNEKIPGNKISDYKTITDKIIQDFNAHATKPVKPVGESVPPIQVRGEEARQAAERQRISSLAHAKELNSQTEKLQEEIIADLISENVIKSKIGLSFELTDRELIVNGIKQTEAIHKELKDKYVKGPGWEFTYKDH